MDIWIVCLTENTIFLYDFDHDETIAEKKRKAKKEFARLMTEFSDTQKKL